MPFWRSVTRGDCMGRGCQVAGCRVTGLPRVRFDQQGCQSRSGQIKTHNFGHLETIATGNWQLATGNWQLATGNWQLAIGNPATGPPGNPTLNSTNTTD